jgi:hypothetical protein
LNWHRSPYFILRDHVPVSTDEVDLTDEQWRAWMNQDENRVVARDQIGEYLVSTVFRGLDHCQGRFFESAVFEADEQGIFDWCRERRRVDSKTWQEAEAAHASLVTIVRQGELM